jgi:uncharacterized protein YbaR (Trm112 family)
VLDPFLLDAMRCPQCIGALDVGAAWAVCASCTLRYPVSNGVPVLLAGAAVPMPFVVGDLPDDSDEPSIAEQA